jgi:hypothetical protein
LVHASGAPICWGPYWRPKYWSLEAWAGGATTASANAATTTMRTLRMGRHCRIGHNFVVRARIAFLLVPVLVVSAACGKYASSNSARTTAPPGTASVGAGLDDAGAGSTASTAPGPTRRGPGTVVVTATPTTLPPNVSEVDSPEGFRITLTVGGSLHYRPGDDIKLSVEVLNISKRALQYDPNDLRNFAIRPPNSTTVSWSDGTCRGARVPKAVETRAQTLEPNQQSTFTDLYPGPTDNSAREGCRVPNGSYVVYGFVTWCPDGTTDERGVCDPARSKQVSSRGIRITIG